MTLKRVFILLFFIGFLALFPAGEHIVYNPGQVHVGDNVNFSVQPIDSSANFTYKWNFGDGSPQVTNPNPTHSFNSPGTYNISCEKKHGQIAINITATITVTDNREVKANGNNFKAGIPVSFEAKNFSGSNLHWDFGDGTVENGPKNKSHTYSSQGNYTVKVKEIGGGPSSEITTTVNVAPDNREITFSPSSPMAGQEVNFEVKNFSSSNLKWEFGDGSTENGGATRKHTYSNQGNYTVKVTDLSIGNQSYLEKSISILPDNRSINFTPQNPGLYEEVTFTASGFSSPTIKWDFDKGDVKPNGTTVEKHIFKNLGQYNIKAKEAGTEMPFKKVVLNVSQDKRKVVASPPSGMVGANVTLKLENSSVNTVNWIIGQERKNNSPKQIQFQFLDPGNYDVTAEITGQTPVKTTVNITDNRKINAKPRIAFSGSEISFDTINFNSSGLKWNFGDGTIMNGGKQMKHKFVNPGNFIIRVFDFNGQAKKPVKLRLNVRPDNRSIAANYEVIYVNIDVEFSARNFGDNRIRWNFGDGTVMNNGKNIKHRFRSPGNYKVSAVDFNGTDSKKIEKYFRVENDRRDIEAPLEILTGVPTDITLKNTNGGNFEWRFSDGKGASGSVVRSMKFDTPGIRTVTIIDRSGKFPPLKKKIKIVPDPRKIISDLSATLPGEKVKFTAVNFKGVKVQWNFGDGTQPVLGGKTIYHKFGRTGIFNVVVKDKNGFGKKLFNKSVKVAEILPGFDINTIELVFTDGKYYRVIPKNSTPPRYKVRFKATGRGFLRGKWILDDNVFGQFSVIMFDNKVTTIKSVDLPALPVIDTGVHKLTFRFENFSFKKKIPFLRYFVSNGAAIKIVSPNPGSKLVKGEKVLLKWYLRKERQKFEVAISDIPFRFLEDKQISWIDVGFKKNYAPDLSGYGNGKWVFWMVRVVDSSGSMVNSSETASFKIAD